MSGRGGSHVTGGRDLHADGLKELCAMAADAHAGGWLVSVGDLFDPNKETKTLVQCDCHCICYTFAANDFTRDMQSRMGFDSRLLCWHNDMQKSTLHCCAA